IAGTPVVTLYLSSSDTDADLFVYLVAVAPKTKKISYITEGHFRASHRKEASDSSIPPDADPTVPLHTFHKEDEQMLERGQTVQVRFGLLPIAYQFDSGASIQLRISGKDDRHFYDSNPPTGRDVTLYASADQVSCLELPVVDSE
ncbi:CocE/NonD hydrolase, partial [Thraustotheca clavata]